MRDPVLLANGVPYRLLANQPVRARNDHVFATAPCGTLDRTDIDTVGAHAPGHRPRPPPIQCVCPGRIEPRDLYAA